MSSDSLTFRDYHNLEETSRSDLSQNNPAEEDESTPNHSEVDELGKWFAAYLPGEQRTQVRNTVTRKLSSISATNPVSREEIGQKASTAIREIQEADPTATKKPPIEMSVLEASIREISSNSDTAILCTSESEVMDVVSLLFLAIAERLQNRDSLRKVVLAQHT